MIWLIWLGLALALAALGVWAGSKEEYIFGLLCICAGLVLVWAAAGIFSARAYWVFAALVWIAIAYPVAIKGGGYSTISGLCLIAAGLAVLPARLSGGEYAYGNIWLAGSDVLGVCAILALGWPIAGDVIHRVGSMADSHRPGGVAGGVSHRAGHQEAQD